MYGDGRTTGTFVSGVLAQRRRRHSLVFLVFPTLEHGRWCPSSFFQDGHTSSTSITRGADASKNRKWTMNLMEKMPGYREMSAVDDDDD